MSSPPLSPTATDTDPKTQEEEVVRKFPRPARRYANRPVGMSMFREEMDLGTQKIPEEMLRESREVGVRIDSKMNVSSRPVVHHHQQQEEARTESPRMQDQFERTAEHMSMSVCEGETFPTEPEFTETPQSCMAPVIVPVTIFFSRVANLVHSKVPPPSPPPQQYPCENLVAAPVPLQRRNAIRRPPPAPPAPALARRNAVRHARIPSTKYWVLDHELGGLADGYYLSQRRRTTAQPTVLQRPVSFVHLWDETEGKWYMARRPPPAGAGSNDDDAWDGNGATVQVPDPVARSVSFGSEENLDCRIPEVVPVAKRFSFGERHSDEVSHFEDKTRQLSLPSNFSVGSSLYEDSEVTDEVVEVVLRTNSAAAISREGGENSSILESSDRDATVSGISTAIQRYLDEGEVPYEDLPDPFETTTESTPGCAAEAHHSVAVDDYDRPTGRPLMVVNPDVPAPLHIRRYKSDTDNSSSCSSQSGYSPESESNITQHSPVQRMDSSHTHPALVFLSRDQAYLAAYAAKWGDEAEEPIDQSLFAGFDAVLIDDVESDSLSLYSKNLDAMDDETNPTVYSDSCSDAKDIDFNLLLPSEQALPDDHFYEHFAFADVILQQPKADVPHSKMLSATPEQVGPVARRFSPGEADSP